MIRAMRIPIGRLFIIGVVALLLGGCGQPDSTPGSNPTPVVRETIAPSPFEVAQDPPTPNPQGISTPVSTLPPSPNTIRQALPEDVLQLFIGELAAILKNSPAEFRSLGKDLVNDFIASYGSKGMTGDAHFFKICFAHSDGQPPLRSGWALLPSDTADITKLNSLKAGNDPTIRALGQFPISLRLDPMSWTLLGHSNFASMIAAACPLFSDLVNGPFERYRLWRSWEPDQTAFAATDIAQEMSRTTYGDIVDYTLALVLYGDEAEKKRLLERVIENSPATRISSTAFKQLFNANQQQPEHARALAERWLKALTEAQAPDGELLEVLHRLEGVATDSLYRAVLQSRIQRVTEQDYLGELETDKDFLGAGGFRFAPSTRTVLDGTVVTGVDQNSISKFGSEVITEALSEWLGAFQNKITFEVSYLPLPPRQKGGPVCVEDPSLGALDWTVYAYNQDNYEQFGTGIGKPPTIGPLPAGLAVTPLHGPCRTIGVREDILSGDPKKLEYVILHEIGHIFGLPHSPHPGDVMSGSHSTNNILSDRDKRTIEKLYSTGR